MTNKPTEFNDADDTTDAISPLGLQAKANTKKVADEVEESPISKKSPE
jgi:hypothetical protein